ESEPAAPSDPPDFTTSVRRRRLQCLVALARWQDVLSADDALKHDLPKSSGSLRAEVDYARGRALAGLARFDEARAAFQTVIEARKGSELAAEAQLMRGETFFHQKNYHEALREFLKVDIFYPNSQAWRAAALLEAGKVYEQLARWADAAETYERLCAKFPD